MTFYFPSQEFHLCPSPGGPEHAAGADVDTDVPAPARPQVPGLPGHDAGQMVRIVIMPQDNTGTLIGHYFEREREKEREREIRGKVR